MALYTSVAAAGAGKQVTYDITSRARKADGLTWHEINISDVREWSALTESACIPAALDFANKFTVGVYNIGYYNNASLLDGGSTPAGFDRNISFASREDKRQVGSFILTRTITTQIIFRGGGSLNACSLSVSGGYTATFPRSLTITRSQGTKIKWWLRDLNGVGVVTQAAQGESTSSTVNLSLTMPCILWYWAEDNAGTIGAARVAIFFQ